VGVLRSLLPFIERTGIATAAEIGVDTLAARLRDDAVANDRMTFLPRLVGAWTKIADAAVVTPAPAEKDAPRR
jgi:hypothetical protein